GSASCFLFQLSRSVIEEYRGHVMEAEIPVREAPPPSGGTRRVGTHHLRPNTSSTTAGPRARKMARSPTDTAGTGQIGSPRPVKQLKIPLAIERPSPEHETHYVYRAQGWRAGRAGSNWLGGAFPNRTLLCLQRASFQQDEVRVQT